MTGLNYITNDEGVRTALFIDLERLRKAKISDTKYRQFLEDLEDMIAVELSRNEKSRPYDEFISEVLEK